MARILEKKTQNIVGSGHCSSGGGQMVTELASYSDDPSSNLSSKNVLKTKIIRKEAGDGLFMKL